MEMKLNQRLNLASLSFLCALEAGACTSSNLPVTDGTCVADPATDCSLNGQSADSLSLTGYSCTGSARPDENGVFIQGVPQGLVCADQSTPASDGSKKFCCSSQTTTCAYNPVATCPDVGTYGYQCRGADRPEALNPTISCNQAVREDDLFDYCCSGTARTPACTNSDSAGCAAGMVGWICPGDANSAAVPTAQDLGANKSRADLYYLLCPIPTPARNPGQVVYCCFVPALSPVGGTCIQDLKVPGCAAGRFGIACYGPDSPEENYPRLSCPDKGVPGKSAEGYPATVYCCDFKPQP